MAMMSLHFADQVPFRQVHLTGLVRDADGQKMSKTKGNTLDPLELVDEFGADAVRFTLAVLDSPGRDIPLDLERMAGYRAFGNKIWNATRFVLTRIGDDAQVDAELPPIDQLATPERWILSRLSRTADEVGASFGEFRFDEACNRLYQFFWRELCDWYIELAKPALSGRDGRPAVGQTLVVVLDRSLRLLHPVMPHLTEELWQRLPGVTRLGLPSLALAPYPEQLGWSSAEIDLQMQDVIEVLSRVRSLRKELGIAERAEIKLHIESAPASLRELLLEHKATVAAILRAQVVEGAGPDDSVRDRVAGAELAVEIERQALGESERQRLLKELERIETEIGNARGRLDNPQFVAKAPAAVVEGSRQRLAELEERKALIAETLAS